MNRTSSSDDTLDNAGYQEGPLRLRLFHLLCGLSALAAASGMLGWIIGSPPLRSVVPGAVEMKVNTALCLGLLAAALWMRLREGGPLVTASRVLGALVALVGAVTLAEYAFDWNAGIDELLFRDTVQVYNSAPGRMAPFSAVAFLLLGAGVAAPRTPRWYTFFIATALLHGAVGCIAFMGYALGARELTTDDWVPPVALNTSAAFCMLGVAALLSERQFVQIWRVRALGSLPWKMLTGFAFALLLVSASGAFAYRMQMRTTEANRSLAEAAEVRTTLLNIHALLADAEIAQRNYLLLADDTHRLRMDDLLTQMREHSGSLRTALPADDGLLPQVSRLTTLLQRREESLRLHVGVADLEGLEAAVTAILTSNALGDQHAMRTLLGEMDQQVRDRIGVLSSSAVQSRNYMLTSLVTSIALATVALVLLFLSILRDLQERARVTRALRGAEEQARRATRAKSEFLAAMSHEIRTPMNGVIGMLDLLEQGSLQNQQLEMVRLTRESADALLAIIEDILDFSKIEAGRMEIERAPLSLADTVERACAVLDRLAERQGVQLSVYCDPALPAQVLGDPVRVRQVLINLVSNAIKFSARQERAGSVAVRMRLAELAPGRAVVELSVADNGVGMDETTRAGLFRPFMQADVSTTRRFGGTGLGLAITHQLVQLMQGQIAVQSTAGAGSTFSVRLAFDVVQQAEDARQLAGLRCAVIGPDSGMADVLAAYLMAEGADVARMEAMPAAMEGRAAVWVLESDDVTLPFEDLMARAENAAGHDTGIVLVVTGRRRRFAAATATRRAIINGNALRRAELVQAVQVAAGQLSASVAPQPARQRTRVRAPTRDEALRNGQLVLVAEDNSTNQRVVQQQLRLLGITADIAADGEQALQMWRSGHYALVLTDLHMPKLDGYDLALAIRTAEGRVRRTPLIALTANASPGEDERCRAAGMDGYLTKPATLDALEAVLRRWLPQASEPGPVDLTVLRSLVGDDSATLRELLLEFRSGAETLGRELERASAAGNLQAVAAAAHTLKSSSRSVGALQLGTLCEQLEQAGHDADPGNVVRILETLREELLAVQAALSTLLEAQGPQGGAQ